MEESKDDSSPALSDDGLSFEDAADGSSPSPLKDADGESNVGDANEKSSSLSATSDETAVKNTKTKGTGVAALMAKFQNGVDPNAGSPTSASSSRNTSRDVSPEAPKRLTRATSSKGKNAGKSVGDPRNVPSSSKREEGKDSVSGEGIGVETSSMALADAVERIELANDKKEMPPSKGALSLLDPSETIKNPFGGATPTMESSSMSDFLAERTIGDDQTEMKRYSTTSVKDAVELAPETPTTSNVNRFSTVSLSTTAPLDSKRDTIYANPTSAMTTVLSPQSNPDSSSYTQAEFLARQTARLSKAEGDKRASMDNAERIKEKLNELRYGHSRDSSGVSRVVEESVEKGGQQSDAVLDNSLPETVQNSNEDEPAAEKEGIDWDFWGNVMSNYQEIARTQPRQLSRAIQAGIPGALRGMMWQLMSSSKDEEMEIIYAFYLKQSSPHEKMIRKDLARTFPGEDYFKDGQGGGQEDLFNVVKAYSLYDEECGYCQGMQFVVGPLLLNMPVEEAFSTLVRLMKSYDLRGHFVPNMPALQLRLFQYDRLLEETLPLLHRHLVRSGIKSSMYASGWFMTLFSYRSPLKICFRILDSVFAEGIEALFRFALALMKKNEEALLQMSFEEAVPLLAARVFDVYKSEMGEEGGDVGELEELEGSGGAKVGNGYRVNEFVRDAFDFKITPFMLDSYASDFAEQVRIATAHRREIESLKIQNKNLQLQVKELESRLGAVEQEHVDLVKNVVMAKLAKEEMAEELVRYKLMYAEATLLADQSGVNQPSHPTRSASSTSSTFDNRQSS